MNPLRAENHFVLLSGVLTVETLSRFFVRVDWEKITSMFKDYSEYNRALGLTQEVADTTVALRHSPSIALKHILSIHVLFIRMIEDKNYNDRGLQSCSPHISVRSYKRYATLPLSDSGVTKGPENVPG